MTSQCGKKDRMICLECSKLDLQKYPHHARAGLGKCRHAELEGTFVSFANRRECNEFSPAPEEVAQKRITWWKGK